MKICEYGCGQEAKYPPGKGKSKWSCSKSYNQCPAKRKEHSIRIKEAHKDLDSGLNSTSCRKKKSETLKELRKDPDSVYNSISWKEKQNKAQKLNIKKIKERYLFFSQIEEMRYNPDKPDEKEIQVHCKNHNCLNSREKGGWFTPTYIQLDGRRRALEEERGNDGSYFYCSQECKNTCPCYNVYKDPLRLAGYQRYQREVQKVTNSSIRRNSNKILNIELRGRKYGYDLDHKFSILEGFNNNIDPKIIGHWKNLEIIKVSENRTKSRNSSISLEEIHKTGTECSTGALANKILPNCRLGGQE